MKIQIIFAHSMSKSPHAPFGNGDSLPWKHNTSDLRHFKQQTANSVLVMGSKTFESLPGKLVGRPHVVLSSSNVATTKSGKKADLYTSSTIPEIIENIKSVYSSQGFDKISFIGGVSVIESAIPYADYIYKTTIVEEVDEYDVTIDLSSILKNFSVRSESRLVDNENESTIIIDKLTKG